MKKIFATFLLAAIIFVGQNNFAQAQWFTIFSDSNASYELDTDSVIYYSNAVGVTVMGNYSDGMSDAGTYLFCVYRGQPYYASGGGVLTPSEANWKPIYNRPLNLAWSAYSFLAQYFYIPSSN